VWAILACRPALLGGHLQACPEGHLERIWDHAWRHRMCPPWAWVPIERWLVRPKGRWWACEHDQALVTIPHERTALWRAHVAGMTPRRFPSGHDTWLERRGDRTYVGAKPGIIATLPTWSQTWRLQPPLHCVVTGGGRSPAGQGVVVRHGLLLPRRVVRALLRGKRRAAIRQGVVQGTLPLPAGQRRPQLETRLNKRGRTQWNVHLRERDRHGHGVVVSLARSRRGGPLAKRRLLAGDGEPVVCREEERPKGPGGQAQPGTVR